MSKYIVVVFPNEPKAYQGTHAVKELHEEGSLTVYGMSLITRDATGVLSVKRSETVGPLGAGVDMLVGGLVGLLGGPAGVAVGMSSGALIGSMGDLINAGVGINFVNAVSKKLSPGKTAVIVEVDEDWVTPLDTRMEALGGEVTREWRSDFEDSQIAKEITADKAELAQLRTEFTQAQAERKAKLKARVDEARARVSAAADRAQGRIRQFDQETQAKIKQLQDQAANARGDAKAKLDQRIVELRTDRDRRAEKLKQAWELTKQALAA